MEYISKLAVLRDGLCLTTNRKDLKSPTTVLQHIRWVHTVFNLHVKF